MKLNKTMIKGDTYTYSVVLKRNGEVVSSVLINKLYFTCKDLDIQKQAIYNSETDKYYFDFSKEDTNSYEIGSFDFDITVLFVDTKVKTALYRGTLCVLEKYNEVSYE